MSVIAFFDMDYTILSGSSGLLYVRYLWERRDINRRALFRSLWYSALYKLGLFNYPAVAAKLASSVADGSEDDTRALCQSWFDEKAVHYVAEKAVQRMAQHRQQGHLVTIISASTPYVVAPLAYHLGVEHYLCTRLQVAHGKFTGAIIEPPCYGPGKVYWASEFAAQHGAALGEAYFYSDSHSDLSLLEQVGHPVAVNPDRRLRTVAAGRGWPVERFY
jgi:putative phosphoserine phosphatase/1-acylglycerol-3-phosphate O-acyltransferase